MSTRKRNILEYYNCFFISTTFNNWLHLLITEEHYQIILDSLTYSKHKYECELIAYVLMPNHIHFILFYPNKPNVSGFMRDFKKYTSVKIRQMLQKEEEKELLKTLEFKKHKQKYKIWQERFDATIIKTEKVLKTKIDYIHNNPIKKGFVEKAEDWKYSSASSYYKEKESCLPITHASEII